MKPGKLNLPIIWRGCDWPVITLIWKDLNGNPIDLTDWRPYASTNKFVLNAQVTDPPNGVTQMVLSNEETTDMALGEQPWSWLFQQISTGAVLPPLLSGMVTVKQPTTKNNIPPTIPPP